MLGVLRRYTRWRKTTQSGIQATQSPRVDRTRHPCPITLAKTGFRLRLTHKPRQEKVTRAAFSCSRGHTRQKIDCSRHRKCWPCKGSRGDVHMFSCPRMAGQHLANALVWFCMLYSLLLYVVDLWTVVTLSTTSWNTSFTASFCAPPPVTSSWPHLRCDVGLEEEEYK